MEAMSTRLLDEQDLAGAFGAGSFLLFKHSTGCPTSVIAFERYERWLADHPDVCTGWIEVVRQRPLARAVAERTGLRHETPQAIWLVDGRAGWNASHGAITEASLERALRDVSTRAG